MRLIDNINSLLGEDLKGTLKPGSKLKIAASCFSIYAFEALKELSWRRSTPCSSSLPRRPSFPTDEATPIEVREAARVPYPKA
jgi:hypothetical protein